MISQRKAPAISICNDIYIVNLISFSFVFSVLVTSHHVTIKDPSHILRYLSRSDGGVNSLFHPNLESHLLPFSLWQWECYLQSTPQHLFLNTPRSIGAYLRSAHTVPSRSGLWLRRSNVSHQQPVSASFLLLTLLRVSSRLMCSSIPPSRHKHTRKNYHIHPQKGRNFYFTTQRCHYSERETTLLLNYNTIILQLTVLTVEWRCAKINYSAERKVDP